MILVACIAIVIADAVVLARHFLRTRSAKR